MTATPLPALPMAAWDYPLPDDRIAQVPLSDRAAARLLHVAADGALQDRGVRDLPGLLRPGDLLVLNDTRVRAARLRGLRPGGGAAEVLVLAALPDGRHACLVRPARRLGEGTELTFGESLAGTVGEALPGHPGARAVRLRAAAGADVDQAVEAAGTVPLPPYIRTPLADPDRYQTVYAAGPPRSAAAPTAGLHLTDEVLAALTAAGVAIARVRLEVGLGTFAPITADDAADHVMHRESFNLPPEAAEAVARCRAVDGRVIAVGTTVVRVLESRADGDGRVRPGAGETDLFLRPGSPVRVVDGLLTNFHQPRSSLLLLVAALLGEARRRAAYDHALASGYRFLSFGDCMLGWRSAPRDPAPAPR